MRRTSLLLTLCSLALLFFNSAPLKLVAQNSSKTNVIIIYVDDLGWHDVGYTSNKFIRTPHINKLAAGGRVFNNAYAGAPVGTPSRATLLTGQYSPRHGIFSSGRTDRGPAAARKIATPENRQELDPASVTIAELLNKAGYTCASIGKWNLGEDPTNHGFDVNVAGGKARKADSFFPPYKLPNLKDGPKDEYLTDRLTDEAIDFIDANRSNPFFLYLSHYAVRTPLAARHDLYTAYKQRYPYADEITLAYAAMVQAVDKSVGRITAQLKKLKLTNNTLIILASDNGGDARYSSLGPLRGGKGTIFEGGIRTPLIISQPGKIQPGSSSALVGSVDIFPTIAKVAGINTDELTLDGIALKLQNVNYETPSTRELYFYFPAYIEGTVESGRTFSITPCAAVRRAKYKLITFFEDNSLRFYDLQNDIAESNNIASVRNGEFTLLSSALMTWLRENGAMQPSMIDFRQKPAGR